MKIKPIEIVKPATEYMLRVRVRRGSVPRINVVDCVKYTDASVWIWEGLRTVRSSRVGVHERFFPMSEAPEAYEYMMELLATWLETAAADAEEALAMAAMLNAFKDRNWTLKNYDQ